MMAFADPVNTAKIHVALKILLSIENKVSSPIKWDQYVLSFLSNFTIGMLGHRKL